MSLAELQKYTFTAKYARWNKDLKRRETWNEAVSRVKNMMLEKYKDKPEVHEDIDFAYDMMKKKRVLGSQRALQFGGAPIFKHEMKVYNCSASYCDRPRFFAECMYLLLCGVGVGFSVQYQHVNKLNPVNSLSGTKQFEVQDSIEGWADCIGVLIESYIGGPDFPDFHGVNVDIDFSKIRKAGEPVGEFGKAPGPEALKKSIEHIRTILNGAVGRKLKPIECYDIVMHSSDAVLSGGIRRAATIALFSHNDQEMMTAKTRNWFYENPQRGRSNNSVVLVKNQTSFDQFKKIIENVKEFGEPGFLLVDDTDVIVNPCCEIGLYGYNENGESGWQVCNLSSINGAKVKTREDFLESCRAAAIIGTLQAGFTNPGYLTDVSRQIIEREALLGVSMTGIMESPDICLDPEIQRAGAEVVKSVNREIAAKIGINPAARATTIKPEGSASCVLGTSSGIHPHHARRYIRRVQANRLENVYQHFKKTNPKACEKSVWSNNGTDDVIAFCVEVPEGSRLKNKISAIKLLEAVKLTQENWINGGKTPELCVQPYLTHNVSNTINVKADEWDEVTRYIYDNREFFCGISILPVTGDKDYPQAPFTSIYTPPEMVKFYGDGVMFVSGLIDKALELWEDNLWAACDSLNLRRDINGAAKKNWVGRCEKFAIKYFEGDLRRLTYAMKDVYNYKLWTELQISYQDVNYEEMSESTDNTSTTQEWACSGGKCELI